MPLNHADVAHVAAAAAEWDEWYSGWTLNEKGERLPVADRWRRCWQFLCDQGMTQDEALQVERPWPAHNRLYFEQCRGMLETRLFLAPKSRRRFATWTAAGLLWWFARYTPASLCLVQSLNEEKAGHILQKRIAWLEDHVREPIFRRPYQAWSGASGYYRRLSWEASGGGEILGVKEGGDAVRSHTASIIFLDEVDFQPHAPDAFRAMVPLLEPGKRVKLIAVTTMNGPGGQVAQRLLDVGFGRFTE